MSIGEVVRAPCRTCNVETKHTIRGEYESDWSTPDDEVSGGAMHEILSCNGCNTVTCRVKSWSTEDWDGPNTEYWPNEARAEREPREFKHLSSGVFESPMELVYVQTVKAYSSGLLTLAGAGVRLLVEGICRDCGIADGEVVGKSGKSTRKKTLEGKINGLHENGFVGKKQTEMLHEIRFLGNDAAHELDQPSKATVSAAIDIVESIIDQVYEQPPRAKKLASRKRPKRRP